MKNWVALAAACVIICVCCVTPSHSAPVTWEFTGAGGDVTGNVTIEDTHPDYAPNSSCTATTGCITDYLYTEISTGAEFGLAQGDQAPNPHTIFFGGTTQPDDIQTVTVTVVDSAIPLGNDGTFDIFASRMAR